MNEKDREFMLKIAKRLGDIEIELIALKAGKEMVKHPSKPLQNASQAANKFFGGDIPSNEPNCNGSAIFKDDNTSQETFKQVEHGMKLLKKAVIELCEEFQLKEFHIDYIDPTPKK